MQENLESNEPSLKQRLSLVTLKIFLVATAFGAAALAIVEAGLTIPIAGTGVVTDPREIFTTTGAALTGPLGGIVIGILAGFREPGGAIGASLLAHISGGLWIGLAYKLLVYKYLKMPFLLIGWIAVVMAYYYVLVVPGFVIGHALFYSEVFAESYGTGTSVGRAYTILAWGALPEALLTALVTSLVIIALPRRHRRPLW